MKKLIAMATALLLSVGVYAQREVGTFTIMPKAGMNIAALTDAEGSDVRIGFVGGAEAEYQFHDMFSVSAGLLYSMQGLTADRGGSDVTYKMDYLNVPILVNCYVVKGLAVKLGIQPGFNINSKSKVEGGKTTVETELDAKTLDFSIPVGVSYEFANFQLDARYNWGLTKVIDAPDASPKNSVFQLTLGYKFEL